MNYPRIANADEKLREICTEGINSKYQEDLKNTAYLRLEQELAIVRRQGSASGYLTVIYALRAAQATAEEIFFYGCMASSVLSYVADLSSIDPLTANPRLYSEFHFGLHGDYKPAFEIRVRKEYHERLIRYFEYYPGPEKITKRLDEFGTVFGVYVGEADENEPRDVFRINMIPGGDEPSDAEAFLSEDIVAACSPQSDEEYVKCAGFSHSTGAWKDNAEILLKDGTAPLKDLIANREDVYEYLMEHGVVREMAFRIAEYVRKGKARRKGWADGMLEAMQEAKIPEWYIRSCEKIEYLFPRAHVLLYYRKYIKHT